MGCIPSNSRIGISQPHSIVKKNFKYPTKVKIDIKVKDQTGKVTGSNAVLVNFTKPLVYSTESLGIGRFQHLSRCVLPGIDPRDEHGKKCQDMCLYLHNSSDVLLALFDGHGKEGEKVSAACSDVVEAYFKEHFMSPVENPLKDLETLCNECDSFVKKQSNIDSVTSGR